MKNILLTVLGTLTLALPAAAQPTAFTYQGQLDVGGLGAFGGYDFQFRLFDSATSGTQLGPTICADNLLLVNGIFTTTLDFGQQYTTSTPRFLEVQVRADSGLDCSNLSGLLLLAPRQQITPAPLAAHAIGALALDAPNGAHPDALFVDNSGRLGIGTVTPQATLHVLTNGEGVRVQASTENDLALVNFVDAAGTLIGTVGSNSGGINRISLGSSTGDTCLLPAGAPALTVSALGGVGIGTTAPAARLDVRGDINFGTISQFSAIAGSEPVRIVCGVFNSSGNVTSGTGFTVSHTTTGKYRIDFVPPFRGLPAITATVSDIGGNEGAPMMEGANSAGVSMNVFARDDGGYIDRGVQFIAVGPR